jgi:FAD dependent oxidoreductase TIGR03364
MKYDVAIAGAGILGLAHAYQLARRGLRVLVCERHCRAQGASVRNFGMLWPIGQPSGSLHALARRSLDIWLDVVRAAGLWHERTGSLHLAYHDDEAQVLREFVARVRDDQWLGCCELWDAKTIVQRVPAIATSGLRVGLWSPVEVAVDPREIIARLPEWLRSAYGVEFVFEAPVLAFDRPAVARPLATTCGSAACLYRSRFSRTGARRIRRRWHGALQAADDAVAALWQRFPCWNHAGGGVDPAPISRKNRLFVDLS